TYSALSPQRLLSLNQSSIKCVSLPGASLLDSAPQDPLRLWEASGVFHRPSPPAKGALQID
ncbi:hypothetical protein J6590_091070, partial [Homalodisca vitripennis]